jgi:hypothetical protein
MCTATSYAEPTTLPALHEHSMRTRPLPLARMAHTSALGVVPCSRTRMPTPSVPSRAWHKNGRTVAAQLAPAVSARRHTLGCPEHEPTDADSVGAASPFPSMSCRCRPFLTPLPFAPTCQPCRDNRKRAPPFPSVSSAVVLICFLPFYPPAPSTMTKAADPAEPRPAP